jgi:hypothetical protein
MLLCVLLSWQERSQFKFYRRKEKFYFFYATHSHRQAGEWQAYLQPNTFIPYSKAANVLAIVGLKA